MEFARTQLQIDADINNELISGTGLVARWGMSEGSGSTIGNSLATPAIGTLTGTGASWPAGAPFDIVIPNIPPVATNGAVVDDRQIHPWVAPLSRPTRTQATP